jgi:CRISPR-associated protein Cpf1
MTQKRTLADFTNKYSLSKTVRFELQGVGRTVEHIRNKGIINKDEERALSYSKMKKTIDAFHKYFIELAMSQVKLTKLDAFAELYAAKPEEKKEDGFKKKFDKVKEELRKEITKGFSSEKAKSIFEKIDKKELLTELLESWIAQQPDKEIYFDQDFKTFTTYFGGFHENRKNMYSDKEQSTAIAYRLVHENLPKFIDNIRIFESLAEKPDLYTKCATLYKEIEEYLNIKTIDEAFELSYFNEVLTQKQIDVYNLIIGGKTADDGKKKIQGLNEYINLYNQKQADKKNRVPKLKPLYKQILSDRESISYLPEQFKESQEVLDAINAYYHSYLLSFEAKDKDKAENVLVEIQQLLADIKSYDLSKLYLRNDTKLTAISQRLFGSYAVIGSALDYYYQTTIQPEFETEYAKANDKKREKLDKAKEKYTKQAYLSLAGLQQAVDAYIATLDEGEEVRKKYTPTCLADYFHTHFKAQKKTDSEKDYTLTANVEAKHSAIKGILNIPYPNDKKLYQQQKDIDNIKLFLDSVMELLHFVKPLSLNKDSALEKDNSFYGQFEVLFEQLDMLTPLYNKVRNYATQKAYSTEKIKLNFDNSTLLKGWDINKETDNTSVILRKDDQYYIAIMPQDYKKAFQSIPKAIDGESTFEKMDYKQIALPMGVGAFVRKCYGTAMQYGWVCPDDCKNEEGKIIIRQDEIKGNLAALIDCYKDFFDKYEKEGFQYKEYNFKFKDSAAYENLNQFFLEVEQQGYKISFREVAETYINQLVEEGKLYLFKIHSKDFSAHSKGKPNLHTLYWKALFEPENIKDVVYKLLGQAELFFRKASITSDKIIVHRAHEAIDNKNPEKKKATSTFAYDLVKDRRYTVDKFQFHVPITLNFKATGNNYINQDVLTYLQRNPEVNIIGLDRGERHLIYLTLINQRGEILKQLSLNDIINTYKDAAGNTVDVKTPYHTLLDTREKQRAEARENWGAIETIKELKEGYISQVVHIIAKMMVEHNAIVVMEDLNFGFKRGRFKVEKQVYQKLEKMLIEKLNYLVFKDKAPSETGGLYHALQLANKFTSFKEMGKQSGFLFYVPAWNTSKIDPTTGFVNLFDTRYESIEKTKSFFDKFKSICFNPTKNYFEFAFDYTDFTTKADDTKTNWTVCTHGDRIRTYRNPDKVNQWDNKPIQLTQEFEDLLGKYNITYGAGACLKAQIAEQKDKEFFASLLHLFKLTLQMRNSITNSEVDYLISPVANERTGLFYDSRKKNEKLPKDADANGAYHIAKKGLWWLEQIHELEGQEWKKLDLDKSNKGWLAYVQQSK